MSKVKMISPAVPNVPWQDKPEGHTGAPVWRYSENPIIGRNPVEGVARIFNSAVMPYGDEFIGVFRGEQVNGIPYIYLGRSKDAIHWDFDKNKIQFVDEEGKPFMPIYAYDPRLVKVEDTYYIIWCQYPVLLHRWNRHNRYRFRSHHDRTEAILRKSQWELHRHRSSRTPTIRKTFPSHVCVCPSIPYPGSH